MARVSVRALWPACVVRAAVYLEQPLAILRHSKHFEIGPMRRIR
jgi:hypothetical protein